MYFVYGQWCSGGYTCVQGVNPLPNFIFMRVPLTKTVVRRLSVGA